MPYTENLCRVHAHMCHDKLSLWQDIATIHGTRHRKLLYATRFFLWKAKLVGLRLCTPFTL